MKPWVLFLTLLILLLFFFSMINCTDEGKIGAAIHNGDELKEGDSIPFLMEQNYPNPFNPSTVIEYQLASEMHVTLRVFTEDWLEVETLVDRSVAPGYYVVHFSAKEEMPSGEYYYTMEALGYIIVRKMMLAK